MVRRLASGLLALAMLVPANAALAREIVDASEPVALAVTVYRDPRRGVGGEMDRDWPQGFAMISETRQVTLPPGQSTIRFTGVAEGMVAVSAIVTGLPGGTIEKNRNADLLSPASLVDGMLGNRVTVTRTIPGSGEVRSESAVVRTRADGGLVLQTGDGYEAVRCSGVPERLSFEHVPDGLSAQPVFTIDTQDASGGTYTVTLTYLAWGFDWEANYVATFAEGGNGRDLDLRLMSWLTILNDNNQSFADAELMAVAGTLNIESDFEDLAQPPQARPLRLTCYPLGSTLAGTPVANYRRGVPLTAPPPPDYIDGPVMMRSEVAEAEADQMIVVTGSRIAREESLGELKLYRVPEMVTVSAQGLKQIAFLDQDRVKGRQVYSGECWPENSGMSPAGILLVTENTEENGLGMALPMGNITFFEPSAHGELLVSENTLRDYASGQDIELRLADSSQVFVACEETEIEKAGDRWQGDMQAVITNANPTSISMRLRVESGQGYQIKGMRTRLHNGERIAEFTVPANGSRTVNWRYIEND